MSWINDAQGVGTHTTALDIMNVLDILKNQDLYQQRLKELQDATRALNEGKFVKVTMQQANELMEAAQASKELAEANIKDKMEQMEESFRKQRKTLEADLAKVQDQRIQLREEQSRLDKTRVDLETQSHVLKQEWAEVRQFRDKVTKEKEETDQIKSKYQTKVRQLEAVINS